MKSGNLLWCQTGIFVNSAPKPLPLELHSSTKTQLHYLSSPEKAPVCLCERFVWLQPYKYYISWGFINARFDLPATVTGDLNSL